MKTDNIYIGILGLSKEVTYEATTNYIFIPGISTEVTFAKIKYVLIKTRKNSICHLVGKDLNTNKTYLCELPTEKGRLFIPPGRMLPFEAIYPDAPRNLSKRKVLKMGNEFIQELLKSEQEKNKNV